MVIKPVFFLYNLMLLLSIRRLFAYRNLHYSLSNDEVAVIHERKGGTSIPKNELMLLNSCYATNR